MIIFPNAKINLGLNVMRKRDDGFHDIQSVLVPIPLCDVLEAIVDPSVGSGEVVYSRSGLEVPGGTGTDLCWLAVAGISRVRELPGLRLHLHKVIPMGAGLGGGSSDGAHTLLLLNDLLDLKLSEMELHTIASSLGSDCPFFLERTAQLVTGRGEQMQPIALDLSGLYLILVNPGIHVPTVEVYRHTTPTGCSWELQRLLERKRINEWQRTVQNTMESYVLSRYAEVTTIKAELMRQGAVYAAMSGSGSTVFGLFEEIPNELQLSASYKMWTYSL